MKKTVIIILATLIPFLVAAQTYPTGITPYTFQQAWKCFAYDKDNAKADVILRKCGYKKIGTFDNAIGYNMVYSKACKVRMGSDGFVESVSPAAGSGYSSYIQVGPGVGMDWSMSVTFLSNKGTNAFANLLRETKYNHYVNEHNAWVQKDTHDYFIQVGKSFSVSDVVGGEDFMM